MDNNKLEIGTKVYLKPINNKARYIKNEPIDKYIKECTITKIGRKYFDVGTETNSSFEKFEINDLRQHTNYCEDWKLYFSKQDILDEDESEKLCREIRSVFDVYGKVDLSLNQLRQIKSIIDNNE